MRAGAILPLCLCAVFGVGGEVVEADFGYGGAVVP